jgi:uncharacterized SAM-binding protein YcdF (DUF218 family)
MRLVVVLGYSDRRSSGLHPICAARLVRAAELSARADAVVLTGVESEAMRRAWSGPCSDVICETDARITAENAANVARVVRELGATEVVVVTSWWHRLRAALLFHALLRGTGAHVHVVPAPSWSLRLLVREVAAFALVPYQLRRARSG